ncbi:sensor histidine kinase [Flavobacterium ichthyis]|nr:histidine kinase [Flavobacterium ichthyis]
MKKYAKATTRFALIILLICIFNPHLNFQSKIFNLIWNLALGLNIACTVTTSAVLFLYFYFKNLKLTAFAVSILYLLINPVIYYLNYSKIIDIYNISYPNYYYYIVLFETLALGVFISFRFKNQTSANIKLLKEKIEIEDHFNKKINDTVIETQKNLLSNLSKDLHDDLGQKLSVINFSLENLKLKFSSEEIDQIKQLSTEISNSIRNLSHWLDTFEFQENSLYEIITKDILRINKLLHIQAFVTQKGELQLNTSEKIILFRIYQELMNNSLKYAQSNRINITLYQDRIIFSDDGIGFQANISGGIGLKNLKERAHLINWEVEKNETEKLGTVFKIFKS